MILRSIPLKDATETALTSCGEGTVYDVGGLPQGEGKKAYAVLHVLSSSTGGVKVRVLSNSSSGYSGANLGTVRFNFTCSEQRTAEWLTPLTTGTITTTDQPFWRAIHEMTTSGESYNLLTLVRIGGANG
ncbi:MAG: hypothetical protein A2Y38_06000 [Spirochaetes bacterium GWB1_59_5]|nr:MAG: hypothetical protein A2Y38_06000 [Spirochaetes bacterium GWB1_59_5]